MPPAPDASLAVEDFCYVTTVGRTTGKPHTIEIWFALLGSVLYILAGDGERSDTVRNLRKQPSVQVKLGDVTYEAKARVVMDGGEDALARRLLVQKYQPGLGDDLTSWGQTALPVAFEFPG
jgi:deazaflavin-dependent oxidoreductase (nitroreductase family)